MDYSNHSRSVAGAIIAAEATANVNTDASAEPRQKPDSVRDDLAAQLVGAQADLSAQIIELRQSGASPAIVSQGENQLFMLKYLKNKLEHASPASVAAIQADIATCVAAAIRIAQQAQTAATNGSQALNEQSLATASRASREAVTSFEKDYYEKKLFEPYLKFSSPEDEKEFRRREAERKKEIDEALATGTPEGNLRANEISLAQVRDAGMHGADRSPEYARVEKSLEAADAGLKPALQDQASKKSTDDRLAAATATPSGDLPPELTPEVLAALRGLSSSPTDTNSGHGLVSNTSNSADKGRASPGLH